MGAGAGRIGSGAGGKGSGFSISGGNWGSDVVVSMEPSCIDVSSYVGGEYAGAAPGGGSQPMIATKTIPAQTTRRNMALLL
jgi:hypothetical protein